MDLRPSNPNRSFTLDTVKRFVMLFKTYTNISFPKLFRIIEVEFVPFPSEWKQQLLSLFVLGTGEGNEREFHAKFRSSISSCDEEFEQSRVWIFRYAIEAWDLLKEGRLTFNPLQAIEFTILHMQFVAALCPFLTFENIVQPFCEEFEENLTRNLASQLKERYRSLSKSSPAWITCEDNAATTDKIMPITLTTQMRGWIRKYAPRKKMLSFSVAVKARLASEAEKLIAQALEIHLDDSVCVSTIYRNNSLVSNTSTSDESSQSSKAITEAPTSQPASNSEEAQASVEGPCYSTSPFKVNGPLTVRHPALEETGNLPEAEATSLHIIAAAQGETPGEYYPADNSIEILESGSDVDGNVKAISDDDFLQHAFLETPAQSPPTKSDFSIPTTAIGNAFGLDVQQNGYLLNPILINHGLPCLDRSDDKSIMDIEDERPLFQSLDGNVHDYFDWLASYPPQEYIPYPFPDQMEIAWHGGPPSSFEAYLGNAVVREEQEMMN